MSAEALAKWKDSTKALTAVISPELTQSLFKSIADNTSRTDFVEDSDFPGYKFGPNGSPDCIRFAYDKWTPDPDDVLVVAFPKTGTTWTREIVRQILYKDDKQGYEISKSCQIPWLGYLEAGSTVKFEIRKELPMKRMLWGSHLTADLINIKKYMENGTKIIYVMRNPKDTLVSFHKFMHELPWTKQPSFSKYLPKDFEQFVRMTVAGKSISQTKLGEWYPHHIRSFYKYKGEDNLHFVSYEDIKEDPKGEIKKMAAFINVKLSTDELENIVFNTSFDAMKSKQDESLKLVNLFRKGGVGGWKDHFSQELSEHVDQEFEKAMGDVKINFKYSI